MYNFFLSRLPLSFDDESFDVVTFLEVIEHCDDIQNNKIIKVKMISNQKAVIGGLKFANQTFKLLDKKIKFKICFRKVSLRYTNNSVS